MTGFIAVHCGAGYHKRSLHQKYKKLCKKACIEAGNILNAGGTAIDACQVAVMILEENPVTNAGFGSNLTMNGIVECDASIMDGETLNFGACGAVQGIKYPISLATKICKNQSVQRPLGLVAPALLVGQGAFNYAKETNLTVINNRKLISKEALLRHKKNKQLLDISLNSERLDTVGAVCVDSRGHVAAASSSGGIVLKHNGRVGQAAMYACGVWADSINNTTENSIAVTTTGTGEYLMKTVLAKELARNIRNSACPVTSFHKTLKEDFIESKCLKNVSEKLGGALALHVAPSGHGELMWGHSTQTMSFGYMDISKKKTVSIVSKLPKEMEGLNFMVSGICFKIDPA